MTNRNPGKWKIMHQGCGGETYTRVYRLRDKNAVMHSGNIEFYGGIYDSDEEAQKIVDQLNSGELKPGE